VEVSSGEDDASKLDASAGKKKTLVGDDAKGGGVLSAELITPKMIISSALEQADLFAVGQVATVVPPTGEHGRKRPPPATRWSKPLPSADQVMTQVELPLYRGPRNPLDLIATKIAFGHIFEVFRHISQATAASAMADD
jgi:hypothetical protein